MKEYNIEELWLQDVAPESTFNLGSLPGGVKSKFGVFRELKRVRNLFWWEWNFELAGILFIILQFSRHPESFTLGSVAVVALFSGIVYYYYISYFMKFVRSINSNQGMNIKVALQSYLDSLKNYIKNLERLITVVLIINIAVEFIFRISEIESIIGFFIYLIFSFIAYAFCYAAITSWFDYMYKDSVTELENAIRNLE